MDTLPDIGAAITGTNAHIAVPFSVHSPTPGGLRARGAAIIERDMCQNQYYSQFLNMAIYS
jgi:hypothetical protein